MRILGLIAVLLTGALLIHAARDLPDWGDPESPANASPISRHYITQVEAETKVPNMVTAILADYRGYDTLFETVVIFTAGIAIIAILRGISGAPVAGRPPGDDLIVRKTCRLIIPVIQLFGLYVLAHGHHSPGGGFQGGVILGASFILYALSQDLESALKRFSERRFILFAAVGVAIYAGFGLAAMLLGRNFLDYGILTKIMPGVSDPVMARYHSMLGVETGVAFTVSAIMFAIFANLSTRGSLQKGL